MAKPRTFVSSTFFDFSDARATLSRFLEALGHEPLLHESPTFGVTPGEHSHVACLEQVDNADYLVLIIGGRGGGKFVGSQKTITNEEFRRATRRKIPIFVFVKDAVETASHLYHKSPQADFSAYVDDVRVFDFLDEIKKRSSDNWVRQFKDVNDIVDGLRGQFAYIHLLYSQRFVKDNMPGASGGKQTRSLVPVPEAFRRIDEDRDVQSSFEDGMRNIHRVLREMLERKVKGYDEKVKALWLLGRYGEFSSMSHKLSMREASFKQHAWGHRKGETVFQQLEEFGVAGRYEPVDDSDGRQTLDVELYFHDEGESVFALDHYVERLVELYGDDGIELLAKGDMSDFAESKGS